jgi:genome maintenance exonuclease 1
VTPEGEHYSSVTTILGTMLDKGFLNDWIARVGEREAERIKNQAATRGTELHGLAEDYVLNRGVDTKKLMPLQKMLFNQIKKVLDENLEVVYGSELRLFSNKLKAAGSCDLIGQWNGRRAVIDFKTSRNFKGEDDILGYFLQCTIYAYMFWEMTGIMCTDIVVVIACDSTNQALVYTRKASEFIDQAAELCFEFNKLTSSKN